MILYSSFIFSFYFIYSIDPPLFNNYNQVNISYTLNNSYNKMKNKVIVNLIDFNEQLRTYMIDQKPLS